MGRRTEKAELSKLGVDISSLPMRGLGTMPLPQNAENGSSESDSEVFWRCPYLLVLALSGELSVYSVLRFLYTAKDASFDLSLTFLFS